MPVAGPTISLSMLRPSALSMIMNTQLSATSGWKDLVSADQLWVRLRHQIYMQDLAENLKNMKKIPLGKYLLGVTYQMLHQVVAKLSASQPVGHVGGP